LTDVAFDPFGTLDRSRASKESVSAICCLHPRRSCVHTSSRSLLLSGTLSTENSLRSCSSPSADQLPYGVCLAAAKPADC
jgi:hypothetical protein